MKVKISNPFFVSVVGNGQVLRRFEECYDTLAFHYRKRDFKSASEGLFEYRLCELTSEGIQVVSYFKSHRGHIDFKEC